MGIDKGAVLPSSGELLYHSPAALVGVGLGLPAMGRGLLCSLLTRGEGGTAAPPQSCGVFTPWSGACGYINRRKVLL